MQDIVIPNKPEAITKELYFTKDDYIHILDKTRHEIEDAESVGTDKKVLNALYGIYYNAFAGVIRSGQLCTRQDGPDGLPEIVVETAKQKYSIREYVLNAVFGLHSENLIHPWKDTSSHPGYISNIDIYNMDNTDNNNIYSAKDMDAAVKLTESRKDKTIKEIEKAHEKELDAAEKENSKLEGKLTDTAKKLDKALKDIEMLKQKNDEALKKAAEHEKMAVREAEINIKEIAADEISGLKEELEELKTSSGETESEYKSYKEKTDKELEDRKKYVYDPNYDHYYSDVLPKVVSTLEFSHTDLYVRTGCVVISLLAVVFSLVYVL